MGGEGNKGGMKGERESGRVIPGVCSVCSVNKKCCIEYCH